MKENIDNLVAEVITEVLDRITRQGHNNPNCGWCLDCPECRTQIVAEILATLLKPDATAQQITTLCKEASQYGFASVCVNPTWVRLCRDELRESVVMVCTVVGFPLGANSTDTKVFETRKAIDDGADEIDMVINIGRLRSRDHDYVKRDIEAVVDEAGQRARVKVILENCYLNDQEKVQACLLSKKAGAAFVKTSTGFGKHGARLADVALMRKVVGAELGVKAAGGIRDYDSALSMVEAGASRIGASASVAMVAP
jgi:deoxyribose-phosphate aldolase